MEILVFLCHLFIMPLQVVFEVIYYLAFKLTGNLGISIVALSFAVSMLLVPLYNRADAIQKEEREIEAKLAKGVDHIKKTFRGDEQLMMLQTYYRKNNYSPLYFLRGSLSLFLQIPFFIAAYQFLSNLDLLNGVSFGFIKNLAAPDALLNVGGMTVNVLPIIMTVVNLVSTYLFTKGFPLKTKIQLNAMALFFLVFLYNSPAGLVFYWTLNNIFNFIKTIIGKLQDPDKGVNIALFICSVIVMTYSLLTSPNYKEVLQFLGVALMLNSRFIVQKIKRRFGKGNTVASQVSSAKIFVFGALFLALLIGAVIPSAVIESAPQDFLVNDYSFNPLLYLVSSSATAIGTFVIWLGVFYWLASDKYKVTIERTLWMFCGAAIVNYMVFGRKLGILSATLKFEEGLRFSTTERGINAAVFVALLLVMGVLWKKYHKYVYDVLMIGVAALAAMVVININSIQDTLGDVVVTGDKPGATVASEEGEQDKFKKIFKLSRNGRNVAVFMLDMAMGTYIPYFMNEKPELKEAFAGFTYYPNTISFGGHTLFGSPAIFGGYEYTPVEMNKRDKELLVDKHNEALSVLPVVFGKEGYDVTFCDPPLANHGRGDGLAIFKDYPFIKAYNLKREYSKFFQEKDELASNAVEDNKRNFYFFGILKSAPLFLQKYIYDKGGYLSGKIMGQEITSLYTSMGVKNDFLQDSFCLDVLEESTQVVDEGNNLILVDNQTPHSPCLLQLPDYVPQKRVDNTGLVDYTSERFTINGKRLEVIDARQVSYYHANMAALMKMAEWFNWMKANGVYDNTRIILVADHGRPVRHFSEWRMGRESLEGFQPLLMVKDFGESGFKTSNEFMTNADVLTIATSGIISNPVNPFTGKAINNQAKYAGVQYVYAGHNNTFNTTGKTTFLPDKWYSVHTDIWNLDNWKVAKEDAVLPY